LPAPPPAKLPRLIHEFRLDLDDTRNTGS
jgi:hypothetical protein